MVNYEEIFNLKFSFLYFAIAAIVLLLITEFKIRNKNTVKIQNLLLFFVCALYIWLFGTRGLQVGIDTPNNSRYFTDNINIRSLSEIKDIGIYLISIFVRQFTKNVDIFLSVLALLYVLPLYIGIKNLTKKNVLVIFFMVISFFFFKSMGMNTVKQGIAFSLFFLAITFYKKHKLIPTILLFVIAFFNHASIIIPILVFLISNKIKDIRIPIAIYGFASILSIANFNFYFILQKIPIVNVLVEERLEVYYTLGTTAYRTGFRPDFFVFNTIFAFIGYITLQKVKKLDFDPLFYRKIYNSYLLLSAFFFLMFSASFSDRFGFLSWLFIPFLLIPYTQSKDFKGILNIYTIFFICLALFIIFKFI